MGHFIDQSTGTAAFFSYKKAAWHRLGYVSDVQPENLKQLQELAGLDFEVEKTPNYHQINGEFKISADSYCTYRKDTNTVLGAHVGARYTVVQNESALQVLEPFFKNDEIIIETAGALKDGTQMFVTCRKRDPIVVGNGDEVLNYFNIFNSHDGSLSILAYFTPIRVVCNNTLQMSLSRCREKIAIRHTKSAESRLEQATNVLLAADKNAEVFQEAANAMRKTQFTQSKFFDYLANVFCTKDEMKQMRENRHPFEVLSTRKQNILKDVLEFAEVGVGQKEAGIGTAWWAYNAVTGYLSHKEYRDSEHQMRSQLFGGSKSVGDTALRLALPDANVAGIMNLN